jgi:hypothetical protein
MKAQTMQPKNQHQQVLWYLYNWNEFSLKDVIVDSLFHKFQTRLSEIETKEMTNIAKRKTVKFINRFGNKSDYFLYSAIDKEQIKMLFDKY